MKTKHIISLALLAILLFAFYMYRDTNCTACKVQDERFCYKGASGQTICK